MNKLLAAAAAGEILTGLAIFAAPSLVVPLLLGGEISGTGLGAARVAGIALIALGVACWPPRNSAPGSCPLVGMLVYSILVTAYLAFLGIRGETSGPLLWPAVALHGLLAAFLARGLGGRRVLSEQARAGE